MVLLLSEDQGRPGPGLRMTLGFRETSLRHLSERSKRMKREEH